MSVHVSANLELVDRGQGADLIEAFVTSLRLRLGEDIVGYDLEVTSSTEWDRRFVEEKLPADADVVTRARDLHRQHVLDGEDRQVHVGVELRSNPAWASRPWNDLSVCGRRSARTASTWRDWPDATLVLGRPGLYTTKRATRTLAGVALDRAFVLGLYTDVCDRVRPKTLKVALEDGAPIAPWDCYLVYHRDASGFLDDLTPRLGTATRRAATDVVEAAIVDTEGVEPLAVKHGLGVVAHPFLGAKLGDFYDRLLDAIR